MKVSMLTAQLPPLGRGKLWILQAAVILAAGWFVFAPALNGNWLWDDFEIRENLTLHNAPGLGRIWFAPASLDYYPLEASVLWIQWHLWHENVLGYHLTNLALHLLSAFLIWSLLRKLGVRLAWIGGLLFVIHPLVVESVAWIIELKNTLSLPPLLMAVSAFIDFDQAQPHAPSRRRFLVRSLLWFLAAMLCKSSVVMLPVVLLLFVLWRRGRIGRSDLLATAPFFLISLALGIVTIHFQLTRAVGDWRLPQLGFLERVAGGGMALGFYVQKFLFPHGLMPIYPPWTAHTGVLGAIAPWLAMAAGAGLLASRRSSWGGPALLGLGWFVINLLPVLGFVPMAYQHIAPVADHFVYVPIVGAAGLAAAGVSGAFSWIKARAWPHTQQWHACIVIGLLAVAAVLAFEARRYAGVFVDQKTEWSYNLSHNSRSPMVYLNLAYVLNEEGRTPEAITLYEKAIQLDPGDAQTENGVGNFLVENTSLPQAIPHYERALQIDPTLLVTRRSLAKALSKTGRLKEAIAQYELCLRQKSEDAEMETNLGKALDGTGRRSEAISHFRRALQLNSNNAEAENSLGLALASDGRVEDGINHLTRAITLEPTLAEAHNNLGFALAGAGQPKEAIPHFKEAIRLKSDFAEAHNNLAFALAKTGASEEAIAHLKKALQIEPGDFKAHFNLATLLETEERLPEAIEHLEQALRLNPDSEPARTALARLKAIQMTTNR